VCSSDLTSIEIEMGIGQDVPQGDNHFVLVSKHQRFDVTHKYYRTNSMNTLVNPIYNLDVIENDHSVMPYTTAEPIVSIYADVQSDELIVDFGQRHGLRYGWGFTLAGLTTTGNISDTLLNTEHVVKRVVNDSKVVFSAKNSGNPVKFSGIAFSTVSVVRQALAQADGSDFYLDFGSAPALAASGLQVGMNFQLDAFTGVNNDPFLANILRYNIYTVVSLTGSTATFNTGMGWGAQGTVITGVNGTRSGIISGSGTYFFDKTSTHNMNYVMNDLQAIFIGYTPPSNPLFIGPYIFDPNGVETNLTVSQYLVKTTENILTGESKSTLFIDDMGVDFPQSGEIVIDYGKSSVEGPIKYNAFVKNLSTSQLLIDPSYRFKKAHGVDSQVQFIHENRAYIPSIDGQDYPFYITGTSAARDALFGMIELLTATGIFVEANVILPDLRYEDPAINIFD
jgi:hypothetical protein